MRPSSSSSSGPLTCPRCAKPHPLEERFCSNCGMPLVYIGRGSEGPITDAQERARKVKPQYARGEPVRVVGARNLAEAELIQNLLLEEGIPSMQRRTRGFDVPDFLAAGPRDILVPESAYGVARELLVGAELLDPEAEMAAAAAAGTSPGRLAAVILAALGVAGALVWLLYQATG
jgi:zinc-ribbon domain